MLYGVKIRNKENFIYEDKILFFESKDRAVHFERDIRFLDDVVHKDEYKRKVESLKSRYFNSLVEDTGESEIELINQYPILVEFF